MADVYNVLIEKGEDGYLISEVIELPGCHTQATSFDELFARTREAIELYLDVKKDFQLEHRFLGLQQMVV